MSINSQNPTCNSITFINIPFPILIEGGSGITDFLIFGSFTSHPNVINNYGGNYVFMAQGPGNVINPNGSRFVSNLKFEGTGEWTLLEDLYVFADTVSWDTVVMVTNDFDPENDTLIYDFGPNIQHKNGIEKKLSEKSKVICSCFILASQQLQRSQS